MNYLKPRVFYFAGVIMLAIGVAFNHGLIDAITTIGILTIAFAFAQGISD